MVVLLFPASVALSVIVIVGLPTVTVVLSFIVAVLSLISLVIFRALRRLDFFLFGWVLLHVLLLWRFLLLRLLGGYFGSFHLYNSVNDWSVVKFYLLSSKSRILGESYISIDITLLHTSFSNQDCLFDSSACGPDFNFVKPVQRQVNIMSNSGSAGILSY